MLLMIKLFPVSLYRHLLLSTGTYFFTKKPWS